MSSEEVGFIFVIIIGLLLPLIVGAFLALNDESGKISGIEWAIIINANVTWWLIIIVGLLVYYRTPVQKPISKSV
jgi:hypothetical protein